MKRLISITIVLLLHLASSGQAINILDLHIMLGYNVPEIAAYLKCKEKQWDLSNPEYFTFQDNSKLTVLFLEKLDLPRKEKLIKIVTNNMELLDRLIQGGKYTGMKYDSKDDYYYDYDANVIFSITKIKDDKFNRYGILFYVKPN